MNAEKVNIWLTLGANIGVLVGIIFLAVEVQQNNELLRSQTNYNYFQNRLSNSSELRTSDEFGSLLSKLAAGEELSQSERVREQGYYLNLLLRWQYEFDEMTAGRLDPDEFPFHAWVVIFHGKGVLPAPGFSKSWPNQKVILNSDFVEFMERHVIPNDGGPVEWPY